jgi:hypothetical protein
MNHMNQTEIQTPEDIQYQETQRQATAAAKARWAKVHAAKNAVCTSAAMPLVPPALHSFSGGGSAPSVPSISGWDGVRYYADLAGKFERAKLACQVMAGFELIELRKAPSIRQGRRTDLTSPNDSEKLQTTWPELVKEFAGISDDTARNWMAMAAAVKPRLAKIADGPDRLREILALPPSAWDSPAIELVSSAVHKITDGKSQLEFMFDLGLIKQSAAGTGGARPAKTQLAPSDALTQRAALAREAWQTINTSLYGYGTQFTLLDRGAIEIQIATLEEELKARKTWLQNPTAENLPAIENILSLR